MRKLLNTLFVLSEDNYLALAGETVVVLSGEEKRGQFPLHTLENILCFSYKGASPALMGKCAREGVNLCFLTPKGRFLARVSGENPGNVLLRRTQYRAADDPAQSCRIARNFIFGKVYNGRWSIERTRRDHPMRINDGALERASSLMAESLPALLEETDLDALRGLEGQTASVYFGIFDELILNQRETFAFSGRSRRPPLDPVNALLSFAYTLLANSCAGALESVGLDAYVGFLHRDRPGRTSLALDLMEELRPIFADRFVLTLINNRVIRPEHFDRQPSGAVWLNDEDAIGRRRLRQVTKTCVNYGQRVQNSVFECLVDPAQYKQLQAKLLRTVDQEKGSLRFYQLGNKYQSKIEHFGAKPTYEPEGVLMV